MKTTSTQVRQEENIRKLETVLRKIQEMCLDFEAEDYGASEILKKVIEDLRKS